MPTRPVSLPDLVMLIIVGFRSEPVKPPARAIG